MQSNKGDELNEILIKFGTLTQMHATAIVSRDGFIIGSIIDYSNINNNGNNFNEELIGGMAAEMIMLGERTSEELLKAPPKRVIIDTELGTIVLVAAGKDAVIISVIRREDLGITLLHLQKLASETERILCIRNQQ